MKLYQYEKCETCRKAKKWLEERNISYVNVGIRENPPSPKELLAMLKAHEGEAKKLFNTSSKDYRDPEVKDMLPKMTDKEKINLLSQRGNLIKRPFLIGDGVLLQGFKPEIWESAFGKKKS